MYQFENGEYAIGSKIITVWRANLDIFTGYKISIIGLLKKSTEL